jgi:hypothetical protein
MGREEEGRLNAMPLRENSMDADARKGANGSAERPTSASPRSTRGPGPTRGVAQLPGWLISTAHLILI